MLSPTSSYSSSVSATANWTGTFKGEYSTKVFNDRALEVSRLCRLLHGSKAVGGGANPHWLPYLKPECSRVLCLSTVRSTMFTAEEKNELGLESRLLNDIVL